MELFFDILYALYTMIASITAGFFIGRSQRLKEQIRELKGRKIPNYLVSHCNSRTDYEHIEHPFNPDGCVYCGEIRDLIRRLSVIYDGVARESL